ncbi:hypothetical protein PHLGIDRAFT_450272 [Phlebiopsis gigantea 11061_1 CR5-6]|uniref:Uncharacterized protein n=1 Tax=Phlebiopsis gigantea (strain 11061_1 CR5-6) TaxID=745531 RepID=A0A0C3SA13_PHLG1|nr:hypothetical protein PHLGIDRAFT_450272 [Phlebiopsis gigantea 11061_1 CR5-6]
MQWTSTSAAANRIKSRPSVPTFPFIYRLHSRLWRRPLRQLPAEASSSVSESACAWTTRRMTLEQRRGPHEGHDVDHAPGLRRRLVLEAGANREKTLRRGERPLHQPSCIMVHSVWSGATVRRRRASKLLLPLQSSATTSSAQTFPPHHKRYYIGIKFINQTITTHWRCELFDSDRAIFLLVSPSRDPPYRSPPRRSLRARTPR